MKAIVWSAVLGRDYLNIGRNSFGDIGVAGQLHSGATGGLSQSGRGTARRMREMELPALRKKVFRVQPLGCGF